MNEATTDLGNTVAVHGLADVTENLAPCFFAGGSVTTYSLEGPSDPFLVECGRGTTYTVLSTGGLAVRRVGPKLPLGLENLLVSWRGGTGELAEAPAYTYAVLGLIEPAQYGTRYDLISSVQMPFRARGRIEYRPEALAEVWTNPAEELRKLTGLPVEELAEVFGVSRVTYHNWIANRPIALENERRLYAVLKLLTEVSKIKEFQQPTLRRWLLTPVRADGLTPLRLMSNGDDLTVRALAFRSTRPLPWTPLLSESAIESSGVPRSSLRRVGSRGWQPSAKSPTLEDRLEQLKPSALPESEVSEELDPASFEGGRGIYVP